jgi:alcohol dehydrogenase class IV
MFEFATATRIVFGAGAISHLAQWVESMTCERVLLMTGRDPSRAQPIAAALSRRGVSVHSFPVSGEPSVELVRAAASTARSLRVDAVLAVGGGSVLDAGKAAAALASNGGDPLDYLEVVGAGRALRQPSLPFVAVPTTAGTGAEVTRNAVLSVREPRVKASLRSPFMLPRLAIVDPDLLSGAPAEVIISSGLDALSQLIESFVSSRANPLTDALAREGIRRSARALPLAARQGLGTRSDLREDLALASLSGGLCLANAGLGAIHGFAAPAGAMFDAPHGAVCAALLPHVLDVNLRALRTRAPSHPVLERFRELGNLLSGVDLPSQDGGPDDAVLWVARLCRELAVPALSRYGMRTSDIPPLVAAARRASSTKGNPIELTDAEYVEIAERALGA